MNTAQKIHEAVNIYLPSFGAHLVLYEKVTIPVRLQTGRLGLAVQIKQDTYPVLDRWGHESQR